MLKLILLSFSLLCCLSACERPYDPPTVFQGPEWVVEGYVEHGPNAFPPYVLLTKSYDFTRTLSASALNELFVHGAEVWVSDGENQQRLQEVCLSDLAALDTFLVRVVSQSLGFGSAFDAGLNPCVYVDVAGFLGQSPLRIEEGRTYGLRILLPNGDSLHALTTMPELVRLDSVFYVPHPDPSKDSLVELRASFQDPPGIANFYRIFTQRNREPRRPATSFAIGSVTDDTIFEGQAFVVPIQRGGVIGEEFDITTAGYFWRGDTVVVRGATIDRAHFRFWQTLEYNVGSQGPFGTYVRIQGNVPKALGIWGGLRYEDYPLIIR